MKLVELVSYNLDELQGYDPVRNIDSRHRHTLVDYLVDIGWEKMGRGFFSDVLKKPGSDYMIKVFQGGGCYRGFVEYSIKNKDNPHLPRFRGKLLRVSGADDSANLFGVRLEELIPVSRGEISQDVPMLAWLAVNTGDMEAWSALNTPIAHMTGMRPPLGSVRSSERPEPIRKLQNDDDIMKMLRMLADGWEQTYPDLARLIRDMVGKHFGCSTDFKEENFMKRGNTLVITDPFVN